MRSRREDPVRLGDILRSVEHLEEVRKGGYGAFSESWVIQSAAIRELEVIGEAAGRVSDALRNQRPTVAWNKMRGFSSLAKHEYRRVNPKLVWAAIEEMPALRTRIARIVPTA